MTRALATLCAALVLSSQASAQTPAPPTAAELAARAAAARALLDSNTYAFSGVDTALTGPAADFLSTQTTDSQFVLIGESHDDRLTPRFAGSLFQLMHDAHGFSRLVLEQDPVAIETVQGAGVRGNLQAIGRFAHAYPASLGFASDEDLALLARVGREQPGPGLTIWGIEQAQGATFYLEALRRLAETTALQAQVDALLDQARRDDASRLTGATGSVFLHDDPTVLPRLQALQTAFAAPADSRAGILLDRLVRSAEIYSYDFRAGNGEPVGLFNNTVREDLFRREFLTAYRPAAAAGDPPRAVFKMGSGHMRRGRSQGQAFTIANLLHELAIVNDMNAFSILVVPLGVDYIEYDDLPPWALQIFPAQPPDRAVAIDLRPLRPVTYLMTSQLPAAADKAELRDVIFGYDVLVLLPGSAPAAFDLSGIRQAQ